MTREDAIEQLNNVRDWISEEAIDMAIDALQTEAVQGCDGCRYNTRIPQEQCLRCKRYWRDSYDRKGGEDE